jgi:predicted ATP-grasp superfamily ATP-dependent carboligase
MRILVTDAEQRPALAVVRSLGRAGHAVVTTSHTRKPLAASSRYALSNFLTASPLADPEQFAADLVALIDAQRIDALFPVTEQAHIAILARRDKFAGVCLPAPDFDVFRRVADKAEVLSVAKSLGIATPVQVHIEEPSDIAAHRETLPYPVVLKPARSVAGPEKHVVRYARDPAELDARLAALPREAFPVLVQQRVIGAGVGVFLLLWDGETRAVFSHRRIRENPPSGGGSVYSESTSPDAALVEQAVRLLRHFDWKGLAMVEFKIDRSTNVAYLMEINGRVWGSLQLSIDAGVDFPALLVNTACAGAIETPSPYRTGVRLRTWWGDVDHLLARLKHSAERLSLSPDAPSRSELLRDFLRWRRVDRIETFRWNDPRPFFRDTAMWLRGRMRR